MAYGVVQIKIKVEKSYTDLTDCGVIQKKEAL